MLSQKSNLTCDSNAVVRWQMDKPIRLVTDGVVLPSVALISFTALNEMVSQRLEHHLSQFSMSTATMTQNSHLFDGHEQMHSISCNEWWGWLCAAHTLGCLSDSLSQWLSQNLPSCPFYVRLRIRHRPTLLKLFEIYSHSYATFSSSSLGKKHIIQLPPTICMV